MANWIQGHNERMGFQAIVCHDGVFSTPNVWYTTEELYFPEQDFGGEPFRVPENYSKWNPQNRTSLSIFRSAFASSRRSLALSQTSTNGVHLNSSFMEERTTVCWKEKGLECSILFRDLMSLRGSCTSSRKTIGFSARRTGGSGMRRCSSEFWVIFCSAVLRGRGTDDFARTDGSTSGLRPKRTTSLRRRTRRTSKRRPRKA